MRGERRRLMPRAEATVATLWARAHYGSEIKEDDPRTVERVRKKNVEGLDCLGSDGCKFRTVYKDPNFL